MVGIDPCRGGATVLARGEALPFDGGRFDLVYSYATFCVMEDPVAGLAEVARVLKPGGTAVIDILGTRNRNFDFWSRYHPERGMHLRGCTLNEAVSALEEVDLGVRRFIGLGVTDGLMYARRTFPILHRLMHAGGPDADFFLSNLSVLRHRAARWYLVATAGSP